MHCIEIVLMRSANSHILNCTKSYTYTAAMFRLRTVLGIA